MTPADRALCERYPELPGLVTLLDADELARMCASWGSGYEVERLRLKPGASVTAVLRPASGGERPWLLARALAPHPWATKRGKDIAAAERARERLVAVGVQCRPATATVDDERRVLVAAAVGDRRLRGLRELLPDTGVAVPLGSVMRRGRAERFGQMRRIGDRDRLGTVHTLSHNPARRFVGRWAPLDGQGAGWLVRLHSDRPREITEFVEGRRWTRADPAPRFTGSASLAALAAERADASREQGRPWGRADLGSALSAAVEGVSALDIAGLDWAGRAAHLAGELASRLEHRAVEPAHGDYSPDQLVVTHDGQVRVIDWDRAAHWPLGWDAATWRVTTALAAVLDGAIDPEPTSASGDDTGPSGDVVAAAALLRLPEPLRRRYPDWVGLTEYLLVLAERSAGGAR